MHVSVMYLCIALGVSQSAQVSFNYLKAQSTVKQSFHINDIAIKCIYVSDTENTNNMLNNRNKLQFMLEILIFFCNKLWQTN